MPITLVMAIPLRTFEVSTPRGMLVRMQDKMQRMSNLIDRPPAVVSESIEDTCMDLGMYAFIMATYFRMHHNDRT
jgi:hypothetical protein